MSPGRAVAFSGALSIAQLLVGQWEVRVFAGPEVGSVAFEVVEQPASVYETLQAEDLHGISIGWHFGTIATHGNDVARLTFGSLISQQNSSTPYAYTRGYHALGGHSNIKFNGKLDVSTLFLEFPLLLTLGRNSVLQGHVGLAPWHILHGKHRDRGIRTINGWIYSIGEHSSSTGYDFSTRPTASRQSGLGMNLGVSTIFKRSFLIALTCSINRSTIDGDQYRTKGSQVLFRLSLGYVLFTNSYRDPVDKRTKK